MIGYSDVIPITLNSIKSFAHSIKTLLHENKSTAGWHPKIIHDAGGRGEPCLEA
jgi:hypothetical protein